MATSQTTQDKRGIWVYDSITNTWGPRVPTYSHGDTYTITDSSIPANTATGVGFSGGAGGITESLNVGSTIPNCGNWLFNIASTNPVVYNDSTRGKVMYNDYGSGMADLDAAKTYTHSSIASNNFIYISRYVRAELLTTGGVPYPDDKQVQWKFSRLNYAMGVSDDFDLNTGQEIFVAISYNSNGRQVRIENNAGLATGTLTSGNTATVMNDTTQNWITNQLRNRRVDINNAGVHSFGVVASNTATSFTLVNGITAPPAGATYSINIQQDFYGSTGLVPKPNSGWFLHEQLINTGTVNGADGYYTNVYRQGGVAIYDTKSGLPMYGGTKRFIYPIHQDYFGNFEVPMTSKKVYSDDLYSQVSTGVSLRVMLTNGLNIDTCTVYEVQPYSSWTAAVSIVGTINVGAVPVTGRYFLCVVSGLNTVVLSKSVNIRVP